MRTEYVVHDESNPVVEQRLLWFKEYVSLGNAKEVCRKFGISRKTFYKWYKRFKNSENNPMSLADLPRTPHRFPRQTRESVMTIIIELRKATGYGPRRLCRELKQREGIQISERTIWKIVKKHSLQSNMQGTTSGDENADGSEILAAKA